MKPTDIEDRLHRRFMSISARIDAFAIAYKAQLSSGPIVELNYIANEVRKLEDLAALQIERYFGLENAKGHGD